MVGPRAAGAEFFFSSRRRHTRLTCDWSSDVCSSDLEGRSVGCTKARPRRRFLSIPPLRLGWPEECFAASVPKTHIFRRKTMLRINDEAPNFTARSEERRVGKEYISRWEPSQKNQTNN